MDLKIEKMTLDNLNSIKDILISDFDNFWTYETLKEELNSSTSKYFICKNQDLVLRFLWNKNNL